MYCRSCKNELADGAVACTKCGKAPLNGGAYCFKCGAATDPEAVMCVFRVAPPSGIPSAPDSISIHRILRG